MRLVPIKRPLGSGEAVVLRNTDASLSPQLAVGELYRAGSPHVPSPNFLGIAQYLTFWHQVAAGRPCRLLHTATARGRKWPLAMGLRT